VGESPRIKPGAKISPEGVEHHTNIFNLCYQLLSKSMKIYP